MIERMNVRWIVVGVLVLVAAVGLGIVLSPDSGDKGGDGKGVTSGDARVSPAPDAVPEDDESVVKPASTPPRPEPTPDQIMASKDLGTTLQSEASLLHRRTDEDLMDLARAGQDVAEYRAHLRRLNLENSHAGYQLFNATDAVSVGAAEERLRRLVNDLHEVRRAAGLPEIE